MKLLFICTHNRCRSILSEAITNHIGGGALQAFSAGSAPAGRCTPHPDILQEANIPIEGLASKSWDLFADLKPDAVITLCDSAAAEAALFGWVRACACIGGWWIHPKARQMRTLQGRLLMPASHKLKPAPKRCRLYTAAPAR